MRADARRRLTRTAANSVRRQLEGPGAHMAEAAPIGKFVGNIWHANLIRSMGVETVVGLDEAHGRFLCRTLLMQRAAPLA